jgi:DNA-binding transcriptional LysR family regulator
MKSTRPTADPTTLLLFAAIVRTGSFSAAARSMGVVKSSVSKRITALESGLGVKLLRRTTRKVVPTSEGLRVYEGAALLSEAFTAAERALDRAASGDTGVIRMSAPVTLSQMFLAPLLKSFLDASPGITIDLVTEDRFVDVVTGGFDLVVRVGRLPDGDYTARKLATSRNVVCGSPEYLARAGTPKTPADLAVHNCLRYGLMAAETEWRFRGVGSSASGNLVVSDGTVLREAALAGMGLAVLPTFMVAEELATRRLVAVLEGARRGEFGLYAVHADGPKLAQRVRRLVDHLARAFASPRWERRYASGVAPNQRRNAR